MNNIYLIGAKGFIGKSIYKHFSREKFNIVALDDYRLGDALPQNLVSNYTSTSKYLIIAAGIASQKMCQNQSQESYEINVVKTIATLEYAKKYQIIPIFFSSEAVFATPGRRTYGKKFDGWKNTDAPCPNTNYGRQKLIVEEFIRNHFEDHIIIRTGWVINPKELTPQCVVQSSVDMLASSNALIARDLIHNLTDIEYLCKFLEYVVTTNLIGTFHPGNGSISRLELIQYIQSMMPSNSNYLVCSCEELLIKPPKVPYCYLNETNFKELESLKRPINQLVASKLRLCYNI